MSEKRLYSVEVLFRYYAHAESATEAESWAKECASQCNLPACASAAVVPHADHPLETGWDRDDFVFHRGPRPMLLGEVLDTMPTRDERRTAAVTLPVDHEADAMFDAVQPSLGTPVAPERRIRRQADVDAAHRDGMDRMQQAIINLLNDHSVPPEFIARIVEMDYP